MNRKIRSLAMLAAGLTLASCGVAAEVWCPNPCVAIFEGPDYSGKNDPKCVISITGARNGSFSGKVVVFSKTASKGPEAKPDELKLTGGDAVIPASALSVRYAHPTGSEKGRKFEGVRNPKRFDALLDAPRASGMAHPVWVTVRVAKDAKPGRYEGKLSVAGKSVPIHLTVADWCLPDPVDFRVHVGVIQSPDSVAMKYKVEMWSEKHFELMGKSFDLLGKLGNKTIFLPLICRTHFGNPETMVRWIKDGEGYKHDFSIAEKYLDLYIKRVGKPDVVCFYVWDKFSGGGYFGKKGKPPVGAPVTLLDPDSGKTSMLTGPVHGTPESEAFWKPVLDGLRERLKKRGIDDQHFMIGVAGDSRPSKAVTAMFQKLAPYARWVLHSHGRASKLNGVPVGYLTHVWGIPSVPDPDKGDKRGKKYCYGWRQEFIRTVFPRYGGGNFILNPPLWSNAPLGVYRAISEATLAADLRGFGRIGADFWGVLEGTKGRQHSLLNRYPESNWSQLTVSTATGSVVHPGPEGAVSTVRFEMMLEGLQEAEAKIYIEKALTDKARRAKFGEEKAAKIEEMLKERLRVFLKSSPPSKRKPEVKGWEWFAAESGWPARSAQLYAAAAEVAASGGGN